jgi:hypothetical protein
MKHIKIYLPKHLIKPGIPSLQGLLLSFCFEKYVKAVDINETH